MNSSFPLPDCVDGSTPATRLFESGPNRSSARHGGLLPEQIVNFRDLNTIDPDHIASGVVLRSALPTFATPSDRRLLQRVGVTQIIDLRGDEEVSVLPSISDLGGCTVRHVPLIVKPWNIDRLVAGQPLAEYLGDEYCRMLIESGERIRQVLDLITDHDGPTLIHCTAGKDRTGLMAALLGVIAAAPIQRIIDDYSISAHAMPALAALLREAAQVRESMLPVHFGSPHQQQLFFASPAAAIERALASVFPSPHRYFDEIGYSRGARRELQSRLIRRSARLL